MQSSRGQQWQQVLVPRPTLVMGPCERGQALCFLRRDMAPPWGWGLSLWILAPKTEALRLALYLLLLGPHTAALPTCTEEEYPVGTQCCPKCSPGSRVQRVCSACAPCPPDTYMPHHNDRSECLQCHACDPARGLVTRRSCSSTENTVCGCSKGHFCDAQDGDHCIVCRPHTVCRPGQRVLERGTENQDTVCQDCPPGTFSLNGTQEECQPWTRCDAFLETEAEPGTSHTDVTCSSWRRDLLLSILLVLVLAFLCMIIYTYVIQKRTSREQRTSTLLWFWSRHFSSQQPSMDPSLQGLMWRSTEECLDVDSQLSTHPSHHRLRRRTTEEFLDIGSCSKRKGLPRKRGYSCPSRFITVNKGEKQVV